MKEKISLVCFLLPLKRDKNVWHLQAISSVWRPLAFLPVTHSFSSTPVPRSWSIKTVKSLSFFLLENSRPLSPWGPLDFLSTCLGNDSLSCRMPGFPVLHHLPESAQTHVHWVSDTIQPSPPLSSPSPAFSLSQNQGLSQWVSTLHQVVKVSELQHQSSPWIFRVDFL